MKSKPLKISNTLQDKILNRLLQVIDEGILHNKSRRPGHPKDNKFYRQFRKLDRKQLFYKIFDNFRIKKGEPTGLRLTYMGNELLKRNFDFYEFSHDVLPTPKMYMKLDQGMEWPYYFTKKKLVLYSQEDASWFKLNGSEIGAFIEII